MPSARAAYIWRQLASWYGTVMADKYGPVCPRDWCREIDTTDREVLKQAMSYVRHTYIDWPPNLPQFEQAIKRFAQPVHREDYRERLTNAVLRRTLTPRQLVLPWHWLATAVDFDGRPMQVIVGVEVPADGDVPAILITIHDLGLSLDRQPVARERLA